MTTDDELGRRIRRLAQALPVRTRDLPRANTVTHRSSAHVVRRVVLAASALAVVAVTVAVVVNRDASQPSRVGSVPESELTTTEPTVATTLPSTDGATVESVPTSTTDATTTTTTVVPPVSVAGIEAVTEPLIDLPGCTSTWGRDYPEGTYTIDGVFARRSSLPIASQVFGDPGGSLVQPFAIALRFFADQRLGEVAADASDTVDVNGSAGRLQWHPEIRRSSLHWLLPDGSEAYLRSDSLDGDQLLALARSLVARPADAAVPGFDLADDHASTVALLDEEFGPFPSAAGATSQCVLADGANLRVSLITPGIVAAAATILDRGIPPRVSLRQIDADRLLLVTGTPSAADAIVDAVDHVRQATPAEWAAMLDYPTGAEFNPIGLPIDADAQYRLATTTYASPEEMSDALTAIVQARVPSSDVADVVFTTYTLYDMPSPAFVVSKNELDDSVVATRWVVLYQQDATGRYSAFEVHRAIVCRDRTVLPADTGVCP